LIAKLKSPYSYLLIVLLGIFFSLLAPYVRPYLVDLDEDVIYAFFPSADRAFAYGNVHFNPYDPGDYDIERAQFFFMQAAKLDPTLPYVYHQLARISFIDGDFTKAMAQIDIQIADEGNQTPSSYYVRGLIEGYQGDYADAETDYAHYLVLVPDNWAGTNDYAWILLKDNKPELAAQVTSAVLQFYPTNPWLLNTNATALYEIGDRADAKKAIQAASMSLETLTPEAWSVAYPGNDPAIAAEGVATFKQAVAENMQKIDAVQK
jgi:tetratricopeptide (TPR) repeat protein